MVNLIRHWLANASIAYRRRKALRTFSQLNDATLRDIGLERFMIAEHVRDTLPWQVLEGRSAPVLRPSMQGCG